MEMTRSERARWILLFVLCATVVSALAGSVIGVILGSFYVFVAVLTTFVDMFMRWQDGKESE